MLRLKIFSHHLTKISTTHSHDLNLLRNEQLTAPGEEATNSTSSLPT